MSRREGWAREVKKNEDWLNQYRADLDLERERGEMHRSWWHADKERWEFEFELELGSVVGRTKGNQWPFWDLWQNLMFGTLDRSGQPNRAWFISFFIRLFPRPLTAGEIWSGDLECCHHELAYSGDRRLIDVWIYDQCALPPFIYNLGWKTNVNW